ncbi:MAG: hypothetical protein QSU88_04505, partial [Candidatus Methanoperedens sp.]|nr:hypothetical protein [Candidatus Methanoperedens sp.]
IAQSVNLNFDLPSVALLMAVYYFYLKKKYVLLAIFGTMLVMTKEIGILFIAALLLSTIIHYIPEKKSNKNKLRTALAAQLIPVMVFIGWAYGNYTRRGWFFFPRDSPIMKFGSIFNENLIMRSEQLLVINYNWILTVLIICSLLIWFYRQRERFDNEKIKMLLPLIFFSLLFFITVA